MKRPHASLRFVVQLSRSIRMLVLVALSLSVLTGCSSSQHATGGTSFNKQGDRVVVQVQLDEYKIHMPTTIPAGHAVFEIKNTGTHEHNIKIVGQGVESQLPKNLKASESAVMELDLTPGTYKVDCPIGPHSALGMRLQLTVTL
jgi:uncharacterized cupredoxin-like copper-binding protein